MTSRFLSLIAVMIGCTFAVQPAAMSQQSSSNQLRPLGTTSAANGYIEYLPPGYGTGAPPPLMIFLHGSGEGGNGTSDLANVAHWGQPQLIAQNQWPESRPFVVLSPQHVDATCFTADEIHNFIQYAMGAYQIDQHRIYLTGLSCGAIGISDYLAKYGSETVAAVVPVSGDANRAWSWQGCSLVQNVAIWAFHGGQDQSVSINGDNKSMPKFEACSPRKDVQYTVYPDADHQGTWIQTYDLSAGHDIYSWLLNFSR